MNFPVRFGSFACSQRNHVGPMFDEDRHMINDGSFRVDNKGKSCCLEAERTCCCTFCILSRMELSGSGSLLPCSEQSDAVKVEARV